MKKEFSKAQKQALAEFVKRREIIGKQLNDFVDYLYQEHGVEMEHGWMITADLTGIEKIEKIEKTKETPLPEIAGA